MSEKHNLRVFYFYSRFKVVINDRFACIEFPCEFSNSFSGIFITNVRVRSPFTNFFVFHSEIYLSKLRLNGALTNTALVPHFVYVPKSLGPFFGKWSISVDIHTSELSSKQFIIYRGVLKKTYILDYFQNYLILVKNIVF